MIWLEDLEQAMIGVDPAAPDGERTAHGVVAKNGRLWFTHEVSPNRNSDVEFYVPGCDDMLTGYWTANTWFAYTDGEDAAHDEVERWRFVQ